MYPYCLATVIIKSNIGHANTMIHYSVLSCKWHIFYTKLTSNECHASAY